MRLSDRIQRVETQAARLVSDSSEDAVHDLRVAIRRLRAALRLFRPMLRPGRLRRLRRMLREPMQLAGEIRNRDVVAALLRQCEVAGAADIATYLQAERERLLVLLRDSLAALPEMKVPKQASGRIRQWKPGADPAANAASVLPSLARKFFQAGDATHRRSGISPERLHRFRLVAKQFRYSLELFEPLYGPGLRHRLEALKSIQTALGELNDLQIALDFEPVKASRQMVAWIEHRRIALSASFHSLWEANAGERVAAGWSSYLARHARNQADEQ